MTPSPHPQRIKIFTGCFRHLYKLRYHLKLTHGMHFLLQMCLQETHNIPECGQRTDLKTVKYSSPYPRFLLAFSFSFLPLPAPNSQAFSFHRPGGKQAAALHWFPSAPLQGPESQSIVESIGSKIARATGAAASRAAQGAGGRAGVAEREPLGSEGAPVARSLREQQRPALGRAGVQLHGGAVTRAHTHAHSRGAPRGRRGEGAAPPAGGRAE